jgi:hypothetical protein
MAAHDSVIAARVKQTRSANRKRQASPFENGDLVYLSSKNITFEKGLARKLIPKFIGPYSITRDFGNGSFQLDLPAVMKQRGVHDVFHSSLLRVHVPNDDRRFPGRLECQLGVSLDDKTNDWAVDKIVSHYRRRSKALFEIQWKSGDRSWMPYSQAKNLQAMSEYLEAIGVADVKELPQGAGSPPIEEEFQVNSIMSHFWAYKAGERIDEFSPLLDLPTIMSAPVADIFAPAFTDPTGLSVNMIHYNSRHPVLKRVNKRYFRITRADGSAPIIFDALTIRLYADYCVALATNGITPVAVPAFYEDFARQMNQYDTCGFSWVYLEDGVFIFDESCDVANPEEYCVEDSETTEGVLMPGEIAVSLQFKRNADRLKDQEDMRNMSWYEKRKNGNKGKGQPGDQPAALVPRVNSETGKLAFSLKRKEADLARAAATESLKRLKVGETTPLPSSSSSSAEVAAGPSTAAGPANHTAGDSGRMQE